MGNVASQARVTIYCSQGKIRLRRCKDSKVADGASVEAVNAVGEDDPAGFIHKPGAKTITLSVYQEEGDPEVDYNALKDSRELFDVTRAIVGGKREQYFPAIVSKVEPDDDAEGSHMYSVEIIALKRKPL